MTTAMPPDPDDIWNTSPGVEGHVRRAVARLIDDARTEPGMYYAPQVAAAQRALAQRNFRLALLTVDAARRVASLRRREAAKGEGT